MKKKISLLLCVLLIMCSFVGCADKDKGLSKEQKETMQVHSELMLGLCTDAEALIGVPQAELLDAVDNYSEYEMNNFILKLNNYFAQYGIKSIRIDEEEFRAIFKSWESVKGECGELVEFGTYKIDEKNHTVSVEAKFKDRDATILFSFDEELNMESMDASAKYSIKEILTKAGLNTLLGMGTVFAVLIFLAFLIYLMQYIPALLKMFKRESSDVENVANVLVEEMPITEIREDTVDDLELIAVITAAIAAQEGTGTDGFVVRSIRRRPLNYWN